MLRPKQILLDCLQSNFRVRESIAMSCVGIVFIGTPHLPVQKDLGILALGLKLYPNSISRSLDLPNVDALRKDVQDINQRFLSRFGDMPSTFCIVNLQKSILVSW
jgi:hypothetical protein